MKTYLLHEPFNIYQFAASEWIHPLHKHTFYEIIFILKGEGMHLLNGMALAYRTGDIFFLGPEDFHSFEIESETEFCYIRFTRGEKRELPGNRTPGFAQSTGADVMMTGIRISSDTDRKHLRALLDVLLSENENRFRPDFDAVRDGIMSVMITLLKRAGHHDTVSESTARYNDVSEIVAFIRMNILAPERLTVSNLASQFNFSPTYISYFFKQHTGEPLKTFIIRTRLKFIEAKLLYSGASLADLAYEFGFADESHLCKQFRKYTGVTPARFRKRA